MQGIFPFSVGITSENVIYNASQSFYSKFNINFYQIIYRTFKLIHI